MSHKEVKKYYLPSGIFIFIRTKTKSNIKQILSEDFSYCIADEQIICTIKNIKPNCNGNNNT